jgi:hypothetical protein
VSNQHTPTTKLVAISVSGNLYDVAKYATRFGLSDFFVQAQFLNGGGSVALFRLPIDWPCDQHGPLPAAKS